MRSFVSHLVALCLALHTLLGCCVHHAHAEHAHVGTICESCDHADHEAGHDDDACDHDHDSDHAAPSTDDTTAADGITATDSHDDHGTPCSGSCGDKCQFVTTGRVQLENPVDVVVEFAPTPTQVVDLTADLPWVRSEAWLTAPPPPLPLRLHLWNGLLLI